jgi:hypothetical protein
MLFFVALSDWNRKWDKFETIPAGKTTTTTKKCIVTHIVIIHAGQLFALY